jgi:hypothetical protein
MNPAIPILAAAGLALMTATMRGPSLLSVLLAGAGVGLMAVSGGGLQACAIVGACGVLIGGFRRRNRKVAA